MYVLKTIILACFFGGMWGFIVYAMKELLSFSTFQQGFVLLWGCFGIGVYFGWIEGKETPHE